MSAAFVIFIIGMIAAVLGWAEIRRSKAQGPGTAVAGVVFLLIGAALIVVAVARLFIWS
jgi:hypothetical protein